MQAISKIFITKIFNYVILAQLIYNDIETVKWIPSRELCVCAHGSLFHQEHMSYDFVFLVTSGGLDDDEMSFGM